jgi:hypothetical protein
LPDLDDIAVRVTHVAANLETMVLWLGEKFGPSLSPLLVTGPNVRHTNIHEAAELIRVLRCVESHSWFIVSWAAT